VNLLLVMRGMPGRTRVNHHHLVHPWTIHGWTILERSGMVGHMSGLLWKTMMTVRSLLHEVLVSMCVCVRSVQSVAVTCSCRDSPTVHCGVGKHGSIQSLMRAVMGCGGILSSTVAPSIPPSLLHQVVIPPLTQVEEAGDQVIDRCAVTITPPSSQVEDTQS